MTVLPPAAADLLPVHVPPILGLLAINKLAGSRSIRLELSVAGVELLFPKVIVSVLVPPVAIVAGLNDLLTVGGELTERFELLSV